MNISTVLSTVGGALLSSHPIGLAAIPIINAFLPIDKQLSSKSSGEDARKAIDSLPPEAQQQIALANINLDVETVRGETARYEAMCKADAQETRAKMVMRAMNTLILLSLIFVGAVAYVYSVKGADAAFSYEMAAVFLTVSGTFTYVVRAYFGDLKSETQSRHSVINGNAPAAKGIAGIIKAIKG